MVGRVVSLQERSCWNIIMGKAMVPNQFAFIWGLHVAITALGGGLGIQKIGKTLSPSFFADQ